MNKGNGNNQKLITWIIIGALVCALYVILGAFGAHGLEDKLTNSQLATYNTGLRYMIIHGLGLILVNLSYIVLRKHNKIVNPLFVIGLLLFSLSLIIYSTQSLFGYNINVFAMLAPIGGISFVFGWIIYAFSLIKK